MSRRWQKAGQSSEKFLAKKSAWLELKVKLFVPSAAFVKNTDLNCLDFGSCSRATEQRRMQHLKNEDPAILAYAYKSTLNKRRKRNAAQLLFKK
jgi:predicted HTH transcriptional regulator